MKKGEDETNDCGEYKDEDEKVNNDRKDKGEKKLKIEIANQKKKLEEEKKKVEEEKKKQEEEKKKQEEEKKKIGVINVSS